MSSRKGNTIWYPFFSGLLGYFQTEKYSLTDTKIDCIKIVDYVTEPEETGYLYINVNVAGNYFVKADNSIYDESLTLIQTLDQGDTFACDGVTYFINSAGEVHELNDHNNNTYLGDNGISVSMGDFDIDDNIEANTWKVPLIQLAFDVLKNVNPLERTANRKNKEFSFNIFMLIKEKDLYENKSGYDEMYRVDSILNELIYNYFQTKKAAHEIVNMDGIGWEYDLEIIAENRPLAIAVKANRITFK